MLSTTDDEGIVRIYKRASPNLSPSPFIHILTKSKISTNPPPDSYLRTKLESSRIIGRGRTSPGRWLEWALKSRPATT